jgi:regulatory protein
LPHKEIKALLSAQSDGSVPETDTLSGEITAIKAVKNPRIQRANVYLDGKFAFSVDNEVILKCLLKVGQRLSEAEVRELTGADSFRRCFNAALAFLAYRPRSESETRSRLQRRGFAEQDIDQALSNLKRLDLINDASFAGFWTENRTAFRPRSQRMLKQELRRKGVDTAVIDETLTDVDDEENAYRAALTKARSLPREDFQLFRQRLGGWLQRRGFGYGVINKVVKRIWLEQLPDQSAGGS